jgi:hypothetical protein
LLRPPSIIVTVNTPPQAPQELTIVNRAAKADYLGADIPYTPPVIFVPIPDVEIVPLPRRKPHHRKTSSIGPPLQIVPRYYLYQ